MTLQEMYDKVMASDELKKSFAEAAQDKGKLEAWLKANGSNATVTEVGEFLKAKQASGEVSDEELENVAGGIDNCGHGTFSVFTLAVGCAIESAVKSTAEDCFEDW